MPRLAGDGPWPEVEAAVFEPEDVACLRSRLDHALNSLPRGRRTIAISTSAPPKSCVAMASKCDPMRLSYQALKVVIPRCHMARYDFEVIEGGEAIESVRCIELQNPKALWSRIAELAKKVYAPGRTIRVTNHLGEMVILIGVATAVRYVSSVGGQ
jgi:hypothetical protein